MATTYAQQSKGELTKTLSDKRTELRNLAFGAAGAKTANVKAGRLLRREIARILTALRTK